MELTEMEKDMVAATKGLFLAERLLVVLKTMLHRFFVSVFDDL